MSFDLPFTDYLPPTVPIKFFIRVCIDCYFEYGHNFICRDLTAYLTNYLHNCHCPLVKLSLVSASDQICVEMPIKLEAYLALTLPN